MKKRKIYIPLTLCLGFLYIIINDASSLFNGFAPVIINPFRQITHTSVSPGTEFRVIIIYEKIGDVNYAVLLQKKLNFSTKLVYKSPDLDKPLRTERVVWPKNDTAFQLLSKNSGLYSENLDPPERQLWCYEIGIQKRKPNCD